MNRGLGLAWHAKPKSSGFRSGARINLFSSTSVESRTVSDNQTVKAARSRPLVPLRASFEQWHFVRYYTEVSMKGHKRLTIVIKLGMQGIGHIGIQELIRHRSQAQAQLSMKRHTNPYCLSFPSSSRPPSPSLKMDIESSLSPPEPLPWGYGEWMWKRGRSICPEYR